MQTKKRLNKRGTLAISQILILVIGIVAIGYAIGSEVRLISGYDPRAAYEEYKNFVENLGETSLSYNDWYREVHKYGYSAETSSPTPTKIATTQAAPTTATGSIDYTIKSGDTLFQIAKDKGTSVNAIKEANPDIIKDIDRIYAGDTIKIPITQKTVEATKAALQETTAAIDVTKATLEEATGDLLEENQKLLKELEKEGKQLGEELKQMGKELAEVKTGDAVKPYTPPTLKGSTFLEHMWRGLKHSMFVVGMLQLVGMFVDEDELINAASAASFGGIMSGEAALYAAYKWKGAEWLGAKGPWGLGTRATWVGWGVGLAVGVAIFVSMYKDVSTKTVTYECDTWDAPVGGANCEKCNQQGVLPCSEYQCRSLGQACQLLNPGTDEEKCAWVNKNDVKFPIIEPWDEALLPDYNYRPDATISPPDRGVKIWNSESTTGCAKAFTPITFGIETNEPAKCKIDPLRKPTFDEMEFFFGGSSLFRYNHTQGLSLPGADSLEAENLTLLNDGNFELYVRCQDANGNYNTANFVFKYCVEKGPDTTPPLIVTTNLLNGMPIAHDTDSIDIELYVNEPADCKWSHLDQSYDDMENSFTCSSSIFEMNAQMLYKCSGILDGIKNEQENNFYFRCRDKPLATEDRNTNQESYAFMLIGTRPLVIKELLPNETVRDSTEAVKVTLEVETFAGYDEGNSTCYYSDTGEDDSYIMFFNTNSHLHSQELWLPEGSYEYYIKCIDLGGNSDEKIAKFDVESDSEAPIVVRVYHEETYLKLITNEEAECVYDTVDCTYLFDDGTKMTDVDDTSHFTDWNTNIDFHIKCKDEYNNQPNPNECSIVVRPFEVYEEED